MARAAAVEVQVFGQDCGGTRWYAVHTLPHREFGAAQQLAFQGFSTFVPAHLKTVRHARQFRQVRAAFFPRYLFVRLDLDLQRWRSVNGTFGVASLIMEGDRPRPVPAGIVEALEEIADGSGLLCFAPRLVAGQTVQLLSGPFAGRVGELLEIDEKDRVRVLLDIMNAQVSVQSVARALAPLA